MKIIDLQLDALPRASPNGIKITVEKAKISGEKGLIRFMAPGR
jgi:hypothetical protein